MITKKQKDILAGEHLLVVKSLAAKRSPRARRNSLILLLTLYFLSLVSLLYFGGSGFGLAEVVPAALLVIILLTPVFMLFVNKTSPGRSFIITEKGIVLERLASKYWSEIGTYYWRSERALLSRQVGLSLCIADWISIYDTNFLVLNHIYFTPEQIAKIDEIFKEYGVRKE